MLAVVFFTSSSLMIVIILGITAFLKADINPFHWSEFTRWMTAIIAVLYGFLAGRTALEILLGRKIYFPMQNEKHGDK